MATMNISITVPDAQLSRVQTALKTYLGNPAMTNPEAVEGFRLQCVARLKEIVAITEQRAAIAAAEAANYSVDAT
jgi:hypothetical protein